MRPILTAPPPSVAKLTRPVAPLTITVPEKLAPDEVTTATLAVPAALIETLPFKKVRTLAVPFDIEAGVIDIPVNWLPLPSI